MKQIRMDCTTILTTYGVGTSYKTGSEFSELSGDKHNLSAYALQSRYSMILLNASASLKRNNMMSSGKLSEYADFCFI